VNALDVLAAPWAILPARLQEIHRIYEQRLAGVAPDVQAIEAAIGRPLDNQHIPVEVRDGVAIIFIEGVIAKRMNMLTQISGGTSSELAAKELQKALADSAVHSIILAIDSPGGTVDGTQEIANMVYAGRQRKPVVTLASGTMASAAYWIGSAAQAVYISEDTTLTGSIGVVATHTDVSGSEAQRGTRTTEIFAGKYKRIASSFSPLTDAGRETIQSQVDHIYSVFVSDVARNRGVAVDVTLARMADGRVFVGQQGLSAGLVDGVATLSQLVARMSRARTQ